MTSDGSRIARGVQGVPQCKALSTSAAGDKVSISALDFVGSARTWTKFDFEVLADERLAAVRGRGAAAL